MPPSANEHEEWAVKLFRKTDSFGWQQMEVRQTIKTVDSKEAGHVAKTKGSKKKKNSTKEQNRVRLRKWLKASPRKDAIIVRQLRFRISIHHTTVVTRRQNKITIVSKQAGTRVLVLLFRDVAECLAFSDRFVQLNPIMMNRETSEEQEIAAERDSKNTQSPNEIEGMAAARASTEDDASILDKDNAIGGNDSVSPSSTAANDRQEVFCYIARLLHTPEFKSFLNHIQSAIESQPDMKQMITDLVEEEGEEDADLQAEDEEDRKVGLG